MYNSNSSKHEPPGLTPIGFPRPTLLTGRRLKRLNKESTRLGFSRSLQGLDILPDEMLFNVAEAFRHVSADGLNNIRLVVFLPTQMPVDWQRRLSEVAQSVEPTALDVTNDGWMKIRIESARLLRR